MGKNAPISVFDKTNLDLIADFLVKKNTQFTQQEVHLNT